MKKTLKIIGKIVLVLLILLAVFLIVMAVYNQIMLRKNKALYETPLGQFVELDCGHYVQDFAYERISKDMKAFIEALDK